MSFVKPSSSLVIRNLDRDTDIEEFVRFYNLAHSSYPKHRPLTVDIARQYIFASPNYDANSNIVAVEGARIVGSARCDVYSQGKGTVALHMSPDRLGRGIEGLLFEALLEHVRARNIDNLNAIVPSNLASMISFYKEMGFTHAKSGFCLICQTTTTSFVQRAPSMDFQIRKLASDEDHGSISRFLRNSFPASDNPEAVAEQYLHITKEQFFNPSGSFVAIRGDDLIGVCINITHPAIPDTGFVNWLAVHPNYRNRGVGRALLITSLNWFKDANLPRVELNVNVANPSALNLYLGCGFTKSYEEMLFEKIIQ